MLCRVTIYILKEAAALLHVNEQRHTLHVKRCEKVFGVDMYMTA